MNKQKYLETIIKEKEALKKNAIESIEKEEMVPACNYLLAMRDLKEKELFLNDLED